MTKWSQEEYEAYMSKFNKEVAPYHPDTMEKTKTKHKYNAKKTERNGFKFDSKKEARRYDELVLLQSVGDIIFFLRQVPFHLPGNVTYRLDFMIFWEDGTVTCEDVKGMRTQQFIMKKKMVEAQYPIKIIEV